MSSVFRANNQTFFDPSLVIIGNGNIVFGPGCTVAGDNNTLNGLSKVNGNSNIIHGCHIIFGFFGPYSVVTGNNNIIFGPNITERGNNNILIGQNGQITFHSSNNGTVTVNGVEVNDANDVMNQVNWGQFRQAFPENDLGRNVGPFRSSTYANVPNASQDSTTPIKVPTLADVSNDSIRGPNDGGSCIICLENKAICIALPCAHLRYCVQCARDLCCDGGEGGSIPQNIGQVHCPVCRQDIGEMKRCFL